MAPVKFGYWRLRGLGQTIKLLMEFTGTAYEDKMYDFGPAPDFDPSQWLQDKFSMGMPFPNLPYYIDGTYKITQSHAILKHIARKNNLVGKTECENVRIDMVEHEALDLRTAWHELVYSTKEDFEKNKEEYRTKTLKTKLENLSKFLCSNSWFAGETLTYVDFLVYELLDVHRGLFHCCLNEFDNLQKFMTRFESLEPIKRYMSSEKFMKTPVNGPMGAYIGN